MNASTPRSGLPRWLIPAIVAAVVAVAAVAVWALSGDDGPATTTASTSSSSPSAGVTERAQLEALVGGIAQSGLTIGSPQAPVTIVEYADVQCPFCRQVALTVVPSVIADVVRSGTAKLEFRPLTFLDGPQPGDSARGARLVIAAGEQGKAWQVIEYLYRHQGPEHTGWLTEQAAGVVLDQLGLDRAAAAAVMAAPATTQRLTAIAAQSDADQVTGTPTFVVVGPKQTVHMPSNQLPTLASIKAAVTAAGG